ncbi:hypothetical protein NGRA_3104 [Nosema granulosis]|uniref:SLC26A/SulP transporter domain-containing protein n=1 Tax=Nosema granulosis TaxID=83296 RepID=A0A9P6GY21_9MICR|nr:hypothetical protein NGRA_3104 [Nosema granulosis]
MKNITKFLVSVISSLFLLYTLTILDFLSFGTKLIKPTCHNVNIENFNMTVFTYTTIVSQILFGAFSGIKSGICGGAIIESQPIAQEIHEYCESNTDNVTDCISNIYACLVISTLCFSLISLLLSYFGAGRIFEYIPKTALYGVMCSIGMALVKCGVLEIYRSEDSLEKNHIHLCMLIAALLCLLAFYIDEKYPGYIFFIPCYSILIVVVFYIVVYALGFDMQTLREYELIPTSEDAKVSIKTFTEYISLGSIRFSIILGCLKNIVGLALFNLIHITVNVPGFVNEMKIQSDINHEFKTQGIANLATAFTGYPSYFICSSSIFFNKSGGTKKIHAIIGGFALIPLVFVGPKSREFLPCILLSFIPIYIGGCFIISNFISLLTQISMLDLAVILVSTLVGFFVDPVMGLLAGSSINAFIVLYYYSVGLRTKAELASVDQDYEVIKIEFLSYFMTTEILKDRLSINKGNVLIDLTNCKYFDLESNSILENYISNFEGNIRISGTPINLYTHKFKDYMM